MRYLGTNDILKIGKDWHQLVNVIRTASQLLYAQDYAQPVKPYLRYRNMVNRIIAMPAFIGGDLDMAGIKWIASFPGNIDRGLDRAHSVTILNEAGSGVPVAVINTSLISAVRTAAVSGFFISEMHRRRPLQSGLKIGITGFGIIGQMHVEMLLALLGEKISSISIFDLRSIPAEKIPQHPGVNIRVANSWQEAYQDADIFLTCTVSKERYIDLQPKTGSLQLNVSLRDYQPSLRHAMDYMIVDDWEEICRENTDIENMHKEENLQASDTISLPALAGSATLDVLPDSAIVMFNPMGMAVYDVAVATHYYRLSQATNVGTLLQ